MYLNCHTYYSLRYGTIAIPQLVEKAVSLGIKQLAITDINLTSGVFDFVKECEKYDIKPVVGVEFRNEDELLYVCLAQNHDGFAEINRYLSKYKLLEQPFPEKSPKFKKVEVIYPFSKKHLASSDNWIGVGINDVTKLWQYQETVEQMVVLQPITFLNKIGYNTHRLLRAIDKNTLLSKLHPDSQADTNESFYEPEQLQVIFRDYPIILSNSNKILSRCSFEFNFLENKNKLLFTNSKLEDLKLLEQLALEGYTYRYGENALALERISKELIVISQLDFSSYFLIAYDLIKFAKSKGYFHVGRGSGANSIVAYCIGITDVDPIELDLYFERFINPHRTSPPDFDLDFSWDERNEIISYIFEKYGADYVCLLATYVTFKQRSAYRELAKVFGLPKHEIDALINPEGSDYANITAESLGEWGHLIIKYGNLIQDFPNYLSIHAGGVLISNKPLYYYTSLNPVPKGFPICEFDMYVAEEIGFAKFDILSQRGLGHIKECVEIVKKQKGITIDIHAIQAFKNDANIIRQLSSHETMGCFYIESPAMRQLIWKLRCQDYLTLVAASSIIRPGVASSGMMRAYIERHHNPTNFEYIHPKMKELLKETYGIMVYQEDVIKVAHYFAGLSLAEADILRRGMSGKFRSKSEFLKIEETFFQNCKNYGYDEAITREVWRQIESFSGYSFSKAHSASYAVESYQSLYLKTYYPLEFMVAVINNFGGFYKTEFYLHEAKRYGATIEAPALNHSSLMTSLEDSTIWIGWIHIKNLEKKVIEQLLIQQRLKPFSSFEDFCQRVPISLEQQVLLIRLGAFRYINPNKKKLLWEAHHRNTQSRKKEIFNSFLFEIKEENLSLPQLDYQPIEDIYDTIEILGFPLAPPFSILKNPIKSETRVKDFSKNIHKIIVILGYLVNVKYTRTTTQEKMAFGYFIDEDGDYFDTVQFPKTLKQFPFQGSGVYLLKGKIIEEFGHHALQIDYMEKQALVHDPRFA
ncbi:MAG: DNA polymerase III subunit alpha [Flectobacillus sp.]|uniref:DNA polymerase III subunit alpha n=1 Tax=Flectobacillus sp. TaxID=50419 RepID=UPI003B9D76D3